MLTLPSEGADHVAAAFDQSVWQPFGSARESAPKVCHAEPLNDNWKRRIGPAKPEPIGLRVR